MHRVTFLPSKVEHEIESDQTVLQLAQKKGIPIRFSCNGVPSCAECRIRVVEGEENIHPPSKKEIELIGNVSFVDSRRLACQLFCFGNVTVDLSEHLDKSSAQAQEGKEGGPSNPKQMAKKILLLHPLKTRIPLPLMKMNKI